jgi:hypothetical protein
VCFLLPISFLNWAAFWAYEPNPFFHRWQCLAIFWFINICLTASAMAIENIGVLIFQSIRLRLSKSNPEEQEKSPHSSRIKKIVFWSVVIVFSLMSIGGLNLLIEIDKKNPNSEFNRIRE